MSHTFKLHNAQTEIAALKKGDATWQVQMFQKEAELDFVKKAKISYRKEREEL